MTEMIQAAFEQLKTNIEPSPTLAELIQQRHNAIRNALKNINPSIETKLIGSVDRKTRIHPRPEDQFDIDILVVLGSFHNWVSVGGVTPTDAFNALGTTVRESSRYNNMNPTVDPPTITIDYGDGMKVELVPAYKDEIGRSPDGTAHYPTGRAYWVVKDGGWILADYDHEASYVSDQNTRTGGWVVPTIKILKVLRREYFDELKPFALETVAVQTIPTTVAVHRVANAPLSYPALIHEFFRTGLVHSFKMPGSVSPAVPVDSLTKAVLDRKFIQLDGICQGIRNTADPQAQLRAWKELFKGPFPTP